MFINELLSRVESMNLDKVASGAIESTKEQLLLLNQEQLLEGRKRDGEEITPSYFDDPYFKSRESARRYSEWKDRITPNAKRTPGTPNLFITGLFHRTIKISTSGDKIKFWGAYKQQPIEAKFGEEIFGLNAEKRAVYVPKSLRPAVNKEISRITGLKFTNNG